MNRFVSNLYLPYAMLVLGLLMAGSSRPAQAQRVPGAIGLGGQLGGPSGVTLKIYHPARVSYDFLGAWDLSEDLFFLNVHGLRERKLGTTPGLGYFYGPGAYIGIETDEEVILGISGSLGISLLIEQFEIYGQLTPRLRVVPNTDGNLGGGLGVRYYP